MTDAERFWSKVDKSGDCWVWTAGCFTKGYGSFCVNGRDRRAHIVAYELVVGPVPAGLELDHTCSNRRCVRPDHLEPVTHAENVRRAVERRGPRAHCKRGHPFDDRNTYHYRGHRQCKTCKSLRQRGLLHA